MNKFALWNNKRIFAEARMAVYENLYAQIADTSSRSKETYAQLFMRWAGRDKTRKQNTWKVYAHISRRLDAGDNFAKAMRPFIPAEEYMMILAGEEAGKLGEVFKAIASQGTIIKEIRSAMMGALAEPIAMFFGFLGMSAFFGLSLWPLMDRQIDPKYWDAWARPLIESQIWYGNHWWSTALLIGFVVLVFWSRPRWTGRQRAIVDNMPPWSTYRDLMAVQTLIILAALIKAGLTMEMAIERVAPGSGPYLRWHLAAMKRRDRSPNATIVKTFSTGLFSNYVIDRIADASQGRDLDAVMVYIAETSLASISKSLISKAKLINMAGIGLVSMLFVYMTAVQVIGVQEATTKFEAAVRQGRK
jgi:type II secretory pathway component PulF